MKKMLEEYRCTERSLRACLSRLEAQWEQAEDAILLEKRILTLMEEIAHTSAICRTLESYIKKAGDG